MNRGWIQETGNVVEDSHEAVEQMLRHMSKPIEIVTLKQEDLQ